MTSEQVRSTHPFVRVAIALVLSFSIALVAVLQASAATLTSASLSLSDPRPSASNVTYDFQASNVTTSAIKCIVLVFATTADGTTVPSDMDTTSAAVSASSDYVASLNAWTVDAASNGTIEITDNTGATPASATDRNIILTGITNGSAANTGYFLRVNTYNNTDCATSPVDSAVVQFIFTNGQSVSLAVDGSLSFTVSGVTGDGNEAVNGETVTNGLSTTATTIPFGTVTTASNKVAAQDLSVSTNAGNGYTVYIRYTGQPTAGSATIDDLATHSNATPGAFSAAGTEAFGYTTEDGSLGTGTADRFTSGGGNKWAAFTTTNTEIIYNNAAVSSETTRVGFQTGIASTTEPGAYTTTVVYTATPVY